MTYLVCFVSCLSGVVLSTFVLPKTAHASTPDVAFGLALALFCHWLVWRKK